jgi:hypothetical protein
VTKNVRARLSQLITCKICSSPHHCKEEVWRSDARLLNETQEVSIYYHYGEVVNFQDCGGSAFVAVSGCFYSDSQTNCGEFRFERTPYGSLTILRENRMTLTCSQNDAHLISFHLQCCCRLFHCRSVMPFVFPLSKAASIRFQGKTGLNPKVHQRRILSSSP